MGALLLVSFAKHSFTRKLLLRFPCFCSLGMVSRRGASDEIMKNTRFSFTFYGKGWPQGEKSFESSKPTKKLITRITGTNPGRRVTLNFYFYFFLMC